MGRLQRNRNDGLQPSAGKADIVRASGSHLLGPEQPGSPGCGRRFELVADTDTQHLPKGLLKHRGQELLVCCLHSNQLPLEALQRGVGDRALYGDPPALQLLEALPAQENLRPELQASLAQL